MKINQDIGIDFRLHAYLIYGKISKIDKFKHVSTVLQYTFKIRNAIQKPHTHTQLI